MLRAGVVTLSIWAGLNLLLALAIIVSLAFLGGNAPGLLLSFSPEEVRALDPRVLATVNAIASVANGAIVGLCALSLAVLWRGVARGLRDAWIAVACALSFVQACGFLADAFLGHRNLAANLLSTALLVVGLACAGVGLGPRARVTLTPRAA